MDTTTEALAWLVTASLVVIAAIAVRDWRQDREEGRARLALAMSMIAFVSLAGRYSDLAGDLRFVPDLAVVAFGISGYALLTFRGTIVPLGRWYRRMAAAALAVTTGLVLVLRASGDGARLPVGAERMAVLALVGVWSLCVLTSAGQLWHAGGGRSPIARARLRSLAAGYAGIAVLLTAGAAAGAALHHPPARLMFQIVVVGLVGLLYVAVSPPLGLRRRWLRRASERAAVASHPVGAWHWDVATGLIEWSEAHHRIFGTDPASHRPSIESFFALVHPEDLRQMKDDVEQRMRDRTPLSYDVRIVRPDREIRWISGTGEVVVDPTTDEVTGMFGFSRDVTEHKEAEGAVVAALDREREASTRLRQLDEMKNAFLEAVSHELRTPLTAVLGFAQTLELHDLAVDAGGVRTMASRIVVNAQRLERLLGDLLDLDRMTRGVLEPRRRLVDVAELVQGVVVDVDMEDRPLEVDVRVGTADVCPAQTERIIENLLVNSVRHTPPGTPVWLRACSRAGGLQIVVSDGGLGIDDHLKQEVFEPFLRGDTASARSGGAGLGLSLVAKFAELHGGRAWVEDRPGGGSSFHVWLAPPGGSAADIEITTGIEVRTPRRSVAS